MPSSRSAAGRPIAERAFHAWLARTLPAGRTGTLPLGDDAAALTPPPGRVAVLTTDALIEGTHFLAASAPADLGAASVGVSLSDLAAKGAHPAGVLIALVVPPGTPARWAERLLRGAERAAARAGTHVIGGDTKPGPVATVVSTAVGWARPGRLPRRGGARPGDLLVTTGTVGRGGRAAEELARDGATPAALRHLLAVAPRLAAGAALARWATAQLDTSDGLADATWLLATASRARAVLDERAFPLARGLAELPTPRRRAVAFYGGDYELLAAVPAGRWAAARAAVARTRTPIAVVGRIERGRGAILATPDGRVPLPRAGWRPFAPGPRRRAGRRIR
ncbi:MAG TPA: thiamine-phosphate kinase [Thermoplasmata archaeon]|jgi:thiamine-monophosphate kinase|nr:thiamine-phosphate kinase [Thermoplasmata archaeon]